MKRAILLSALLTAVPVAVAQSGGMKGMDMKKDAMATVHKGSGVVTKADRDRVSIKHEPVASMNWPAMTMSFKVRDPAVMEKLKKDQKVEFEFVRDGRDHVVTGVK